MSTKTKSIALTFDVELWNEGEWLKPFITNDMLANDPFPRSMDRILKVLDLHDARATFFITLEVTEKYPDVLKKISSNGHEIGIHGPKHIRLHEYKQEIFKQDCETQIALIKSITGKRPEGFRAAHFSLDEKTKWVLPILKELGFKYDSSVFPINMGEYGMTDAPLDQHEIINSLEEIPISIAEIIGFKIPFAGGIYFRILPLFIFKWLLRSVSEKRTPLIYFHPHELDHNTPQIKTGPWLKTKLKYWNTKSSFSKFEKLLECNTSDSISNLFNL